MKLKPRHVVAIGLEAVGLASLVAGVALWSVPIALVVAGAILVLLAIGVERGVV